MKLLIQRVTEASCEVEGRITGQIGKGFLVFFGAGEGDTEEIEDKMLKKLAGLRIFEDENGKTNKSLNDVSGDILFISQFTLYADCKHGNRPSFIDAGNPAAAERLYLRGAEILRNEYGLKVEMGEFGADMKIRLLNDGPFTIMLDSKEIL